jgi:endonuclease/exonuclease/phosphatase family metal-dependent hydrolase
MLEMRASNTDFGAAAAGVSPSLRIVTYNIHGCVGLDRRYDPERTAAVLREIDADIICLQEVDARGGRFRIDQVAYLGEATGRHVVLGAASRVRQSRFANAVLSRYPSLTARAIDLAVHRYEPRYAVDVDLLIGERVLRVMATHFGLRAGERRVQAHRLIDALAEPADPNRHPPHAVLLVGDLNEWRGRAGDGIRALDRCLGPSAMPRTFPSWMPVLPLDRIYALGPAVLRDVRVYRSPLARIASDHLPLVGNLWWLPRRTRPPTPPRCGREMKDSARGWPAALRRREPGPPLFGERG